MAIEKFESVRLPASALKGFISELMFKAGADGPSSASLAEAVVDASVRGFDTHGVRLVPLYLRSLAGGRITRAPQLEVTHKAPAVVHIDADDGFGHHASYRAIDEAISLAAINGVSVATVGRSSHHGATGCYTRYAALKGYAAIGMTHTDAAVIPHGGRLPFFGTNPISFACPVSGEDPFLVDMASSSIPANRVALRKAAGQPLPAETAVGKDGAFTTDPAKVSALAPLGGADFGYKGAGLAGMIDLLCSAFTGMSHGYKLPPFDGPDFSKKVGVGHFFVVLSPSLFTSIEVFDTRIAEFLRDLREQPTKFGQNIYASGDPEKAEAVIRAKEGVPVDLVTWDHLRKYAAKFKIEVPPAGTR